MSDTIYFLILVAVLVCVVIVVIYRVLSGLRHSEKESRADKNKVPAKPQTFAQEMDNDEDDIITNPGLSSLKSNVLHKDRHDN